MHHQEHIVSIPQAVGTIAILPEQETPGIYFIVCFNTASGRYYCNRRQRGLVFKPIGLSFNTASGRYYCNGRDVIDAMKLIHSVSIPQAVGTIAMLMECVQYSEITSVGFNTASGRYYCN